MSCQPRFAALKTYDNNFGFMYHIRGLQNMSDEDLMSNCQSLQMSLINRDIYDIGAVELYEELKMLALVYDGNQDNMLSVLNYIVQNNFIDVYTNINITLRITGTM